MTYTFHTLKEKPHLRPEINRLSDASWPTFLLHGDITRWSLLFGRFPETQILVLDDEDKIAAVGHTVPIPWDGQLADLPPTMEDVLIRAEQAADEQRIPDALCAVSAMVSPEYRGQNLSSTLIQKMRTLASRLACAALLAPVRPIWKSRYPLIPMTRYVKWTREDGSPVDPWIRVHWRLGAEPLCVAPNTLTVEGTIQEWEDWTGETVYGSGKYIIPGALQPVDMDCERDVGRYQDPNYWMKHPVRDSG